MTLSGAALRPMPSSLQSFCFLMGGAFWYSLDTTLTDMTQRDCNAGVQKACNSLK